MSGAGLIELLAARLGGRGARRAAPALREALAEVSARGANPSDPLITVYRGGGDGQFWTPNVETAAGYGPVRRGMLDTNGFGSAEYTAEMANQSDDFGAFIQNQMARAESENLPGVTLDGIPDLPNWDIQRQYIVRDPSRLRDIADHGPASEAAPSLRDALSKINANRIGPDAGPVQGENGTTLYRGSATGGRRGRWLTPDGAAAADYGPVTSSVEDISRATPIRDFGDLELALGNRSGVLGRMDERNADVWDALDDPAVQQALRDEGHSAVRLMDDVSPTGRRHESYLVLNTRTAPDGGPVQAGRAPDDAASRFSYEGPNHNGARIYTVQVDNNHVARMEVHPDEIVQWSIRSIDGGTIGDLPVSQRSALALKALRGVQEALGSDARQFGVTAYTFYGDQAHSAAYRAMGQNAERYGFEMRETGPGAFELRQSPNRTGPNAGSDRNALQRALRERMERE